MTSREATRLGKEATFSTARAQTRESHTPVPVSRRPKRETSELEERGMRNVA